MHKSANKILKEAVALYGQGRKGFAEKYDVKLNTLHSYLDNGVAVPSSLIITVISDYGIEIKDKANEKD